jgi:hypothetical protein
MVNQVFAAGSEAPSLVQGVFAIDQVTHPVIAAVNLIAAVAAEILGPLCWAALIAMFVIAELSPG